MPCTLAAGVLTIDVLSAVAIGTHLFEIKHIGLTTRNKGGYHLTTTGNQGVSFSVQLRVVNSGDTETEGVRSEPFYIGRKELAPMNFKLAEFATLIEKQSTFLKFSFTTTSKTNKLILEFPVKENEIDMWTDVNLGSDVYRKWYDGDSIPCSSFNTLIEDDEFQCIMEAGSAVGLKRSIKVHVVGFNAGTSVAA
jgi:hypothetical protein